MTLVLDAAGLSIETQAEIQSALEDSIRSASGIETLVFTGDTALGQIVGALSLREATLQELLQGLYDSARIDAAGGAQLSGLVPLGGVTRNPATRSAVTATYVGTALTVVPAGTVFEVVGTSDRFYSTAAGAIAAPGAWVALTVYAAGDRRTNGGSVYQCTIAGQSAGAGGPTGTGTAIVDGTVTWRYLGAGTGVCDVACEAQESGPIPAPASTMVTIVTAVAGLASVENLADAHPGALVETDDDLRVRYAQSFHLPGNGTVDAIRADLLSVEGVVEAVVYENTSLMPGANGIAGMPGKSVLCIVDGTATAQDIGDALWATRPAGIETWGALAPGSVAVTVIDAQGMPHTVYYSLPDDVTVDFRVTLTGGVVAKPTVEIEAVLQAYTDALRIGDEALLWRAIALVGDTARGYGYEPTGVMVELRRNAGAWSAANVAIDFNEKAQFGAVTWL
jgi:uncharacterized phage protein gp47/JayE